MELITLPFLVSGIAVKADTPISENGFKGAYMGAVYDAVRSLPSLPTPDQVDYIKVETGVVSIVLK